MSGSIIRLKTSHPFSSPTIIEYILSVIQGARILKASKRLPWPVSENSWFRSHALVNY
ncbi:hypothetical protein F383_28896 [Gossypium arboreum]|uniref:Uncharacterized protein n=1 Tax=Gossypium arboreum TaxID=29729 RepID=A0A0B0MQT5_GOSAR|nr:hypothetical protein F383_28896 [Gossypium arboreum]